MHNTLILLQSPLSVVLLAIISFTLLVQNQTLYYWKGLTVYDKKSPSSFMQKNFPQNS